MARSVNFVWNYLNELSSRAIREKGLFLSAYDMHPYTKGVARTSASTAKRCNASLLNTLPAASSSKSPA